ncbi:MAG: hypothetical protein JKP90_10015 [Desulfofustis sp. PB-SRB1]|nr:hypothetical protein [Desulfofustis sp. PB-SRB1]
MVVSSKGLDEATSSLTLMVAFNWVSPPLDAFHLVLPCGVAHREAVFFLLV